MSTGYLIFLQVFHHHRNFHPHDLNITLHSQKTPSLPTNFDKVLTPHISKHPHAKYDRCEQTDKYLGQQIFELIYTGKKTHDDQSIYLFFPHAFISLRHTLRRST
jgi:hypothetical protein